MAKKYLDYDGLLYLWGKLKAYISAAAADSRKSYFGTCATAAATAAKVVTIEDFDALETGVTIHVKFTYTNTGSKPTLNVNGTGAIPIKRYGTTAPGTSVAGAWNAGAVISLTYDGTNWMMNDWLNTTYSAMSQTEATTGTETTGRLITAKVLNDTIDAKISSASSFKGFSFIQATGASDSTVTLPTGTITKIPLTVESLSYSGGDGTDYIINDGGCGGLTIEGSGGYYRVTASVYLYSNGGYGVYLMRSDGSSNFSSAYEVASSVGFVPSAKHLAINVTKTIRVEPGSIAAILYLAARSINNSGTAYIGNTTTYLEVEKIADLDDEE